MQRMLVPVTTISVSDSAALSSTRLLSTPDWAWAAADVPSKTPSIADPHSMRARLPAPMILIDVMVLFPACDYHFRGRSEEHTSELQSLMRISYAVFCLKKKIKKK